MGERFNGKKACSRRGGNNEWRRGDGADFEAHRHMSTHTYTHTLMHGGTGKQPSHQPPW